MKITFPDGSGKPYKKGATAMQVAQEISPRLARDALCAEIDGRLIGLDQPISSDCTLKILTWNDQAGRETYRHTASHILAQAVKRLFKGVRLAIGPAIENGFYYDFDTGTPFTAEDLPKIEEEMQKIIDENLPIERVEMSRGEARRLMLDAGESYKAELIDGIPEGEAITLYRQGGFIDLCAGPHLPFTGRVKSFKLLSIAGAYWRGDENNKMLQRIYGTAFDKRSDLEEYLVRLEEAKARDHNKLGRELGLFTTSETVGQGLPLIMPKGAKVLQIMQRFVEDEEERRGYCLTKTPFLAKSDLYKISGHWDHYKDGMFIIGEEGKSDEVLALRPMTCPFQFLIYNAEMHSYRDLPIRFSETSTLFRNESSGEMHGLIRIRQFTLSEGHLIVTPEQLAEEFYGVIDLIRYFMKILGIEDDISYRFSKWDPARKDKYIDNPYAWEQAQARMKQILDDMKLDYCEAEDEAAFYGPKLDIQMKNVYGKEDTVITVQIDFALPERFDMFYIDKDGQKKRPYIIHRSSIGCYERTLALLIERYAGAFPVWLAPVQAKVLTITERADEAARKAAQALQALGFRAEVDARNEKIGYKIREAQMEKVPYMLVIGDREAEAGTVAVRSRKSGDMGAMPLPQFIEMLKEETEQKRP
ncbi:MAG: threonine--tRNA ligase [Bacillota bacterium]|nr:threonine--tRNA ligase [Bacillota bacterium]